MKKIFVYLKLIFLGHFSSPYAGLHRRLLASLIDMSLLWMFLQQPINRFIEGFHPKPFIDQLHIQWLSKRASISAEDRQELITYLHDSQIIPWLGASFVVQIIILALITISFWYVWGATPGKMLVRIRIIDASSGKKPGLLQSFIRFFSYTISMLPCMAGVFWVHFDKRRQGWHDKIARTLVVGPSYETKPASPAVDP